MGFIYGIKYQFSPLGAQFGVQPRPGGNVLWQFYYPLMCPIILPTLLHERKNDHAIASPTH